MTLQRIQRRIGLSLLAGAGKAGLCFGLLLSALPAQAESVEVSRASLASQWMEALNQSFQATYLSQFIDFTLLGWLLFCLSLSVYVISKVEWLRMWKEIQQYALFDPLTHLPNRRLFEDRIQQAIRQAERKNAQFALIMADLDRFKQINDTLGHHAGDQLLRQVGLRIRDAIRAGDTVARLGGDEFAFVINDVNGTGGIAQVCERIIAQLEEPVPIDGLAFSVGISLGVVLFPDHGEDVETLLRRADISLYRAKERRNCYTFYDKTSDEYNRKNIQMIDDLRQCVKQGQITVYYQPKVDCDTHVIKGLEALARWQHAEQGMISPAVFIPMAKKNGLIKELTMHMLQKSIADISALYHQQDVDIKLSVNITEENLEDISFPEAVDAILRQYRFPARCLELEITEDVIIDNVQNATIVTDRLHQLGIHISIDDFGTGNSSISYLKKLPINTLKIDLSFIREMNRNPDDAAIVKTTILLSKSLGLDVVAEGVEDELTLQKLNDWGCDLAQGFYVCKPLPSAALFEWILNSQWKPQLRSVLEAQAVQTEDDAPAQPPLRIVKYNAQ